MVETATVKVLIIDDESAIRRFLRASLDPMEYTVLEADGGLQGLRMVAEDKPNVVLLDLGLPDIDGAEVARRIREWSSVPIIVLSAREQERDKIGALDSGADDYLTKPFGLGELLARMRVAVRRARAAGAMDPVIEFGDIRLDAAKRRVYRNGEEVHLTPIEYKLLMVLVKNAGRVVTHRQLLVEVWGPAYFEETHYLRVYTGQLRHKLEDDPARPRYITTEPGVGYRLRTD